MTPSQFIAALPEPRRSDVRALHRLVRRAAPKLRPVVRGARLGYGPWHYRYPSGRQGDAFVIAIAPLKTAISLYVLARRGASHQFPTKTGTQRLPALYAERLGRADVGGSRVRLRTLAGVNLAVVAEMVREAAAVHGKA